VPLAWLLAAETAYGTVDNIRGGIHEHLMGAAGGVTWLVLVYYVPIVVVSLVLIIWQLYSRRGEALDHESQIQYRARPSTEAGAAPTP
jgi:hypothetical protein